MHITGVTEHERGEDMATAQRLQEIAQNEANEWLRSYEYLSIAEEYFDELNDAEMSKVHDLIVNSTASISK